MNVMVWPLKSERCNNNIIFPSHIVSSCFNVKGSAGPIGPRGDPGFEGSVVSYLEYLWLVPIRWPNILMHMLTYVALECKTEHFVNTGSIYHTNILILHLCSSQQWWYVLQNMPIGICLCCKYIFPNCTVYNLMPNDPHWKITNNRQHI